MMADEGTTCGIWELETWESGIVLVATEGEGDGETGNDGIEGYETDGGWQKALSTFSLAPEAKAMETSKKMAVFILCFDWHKCH